MDNNSNTLMGAGWLPQQPQFTYHPPAPIIHHASYCAECKKALDTGTELVVIIDRSGSMMSRHADTIGGYNAFLADQKKLESKAWLTVIEFDDHSHVIHNGKNIKDVTPADSTNFVPRGSTALLDAIGGAIEQTEQRVSALENRKVLFVIITDGQENASRQFDRNRVFSKITEKRAKGWEFLFMGTNQDAIAEAGVLGIPMHMAASFASGQYSNTYKIMSHQASAVRSGGTAMFTAEDRLMLTEK